MPLPNPDPALLSSESPVFQYVNGPNGWGNNFRSNNAAVWGNLQYLDDRLNTVDSEIVSTNNTISELSLFKDSVVSNLQKLPRGFYWRKTSAPIRNYSCLASGKGTFVALATTGETFYSKDSGKTWIATSLPVDTWGCVSFSLEFQLFFIVKSGSIRTSSDGITWSTAASSLYSPPSRDWRYLLVGADNSNIPFAVVGADSGYAIYRQGPGWTLTDFPLIVGHPSARVKGIDRIGNSNGTIFSMVWWDSNQIGPNTSLRYFVSTDFGNNLIQKFSQIWPGIIPPATGFRFRTAVLDSTILVQIGGGVRRSVDLGNSWTTLTTNNALQPGFLIAAGNSVFSSVISSSPLGIARRSIDNGITWATVIHPESILDKATIQPILPDNSFNDIAFGSKAFNLGSVDGIVPHACFLAATTTGILRSEAV